MRGGHSLGCMQVITEADMECMDVTVKGVAEAGPGASGQANSATSLSNVQGNL
jgi:hypothetical protein